MDKDKNEVTMANHVHHNGLIQHKFDGDKAQGHEDIMNMHSHSVTVNYMLYFTIYKYKGDRQDYLLISVIKINCRILCDYYICICLQR